MFKILADENILWQPKAGDKDILSPNVHLEVNKVGSASFSILPTHKFYKSMFRMKTIITILQEDKIIFKGRVYSETEDFRRIKTIQCEGLLGYFNDSIVRPYKFSGSPKEYFQMLIDQHNAQVEPFQRFKVGRMTVYDDNDYIVRASSEYPTTWSEINSKLIDLMGGYIVIRYEDDGNYIDYLSDYEHTAEQSIAFAVNLLDISSETNSESISTCIIPFGASITNESDDGENTSEQKIDIKTVNSGEDFVYDKQAIEQYGRIYEIVDWPDVTLPENLIKKARAYLADKIKLSTQITVKVIDLHLSDKEIKAFRIGDYVRVYSKPHEIDEVIILTTYDLDLLDPTKCSITLNKTKSSFVALTNKN